MKGAAPPTPDSPVLHADIADPIRLFRGWFTAAVESGINLPEAVTLATATPAGQPSARMVLLKGADDKGFVFYTNHASRKARELQANPQAALVAYWDALERQVRIEGPVHLLDEEESAKYFATRPRDSQIGAWASRQSAVLDARQELESRFAAAEERFRGREVPLPRFWGGFRLIPDRLEFWQGRPRRLHERLVFEKVDGAWQTHLLFP